MLKTPYFCMFRNNNNQDYTQKCAATTITSKTIIRNITVHACNYNCCCNTVKFTTPGPSSHKF